jgi:hypothetical protein
MTHPETGGPSADQAVPDDLRTALDAFLTEPDAEGAERARYEAVAGLLQDRLAAENGGHDRIDTWSGETIRPLDPDPARIQLEDIAHGLSNVGRYAGQGQRFFSVARHSVHVSREVQARGESQAAQRFALTHDAAEAYLSDVPGPVKSSLPGYKHAERRLEAAVMEALRIDVSDEERALVGDADTAVGRYELAFQFPDGDHVAPNDLRHDPDAVDVSAADRELFLRRADELGLR